MSAYLDSLSGAGYGDNNPAGYIMPADIPELQQMQRFAPTQDKPWWEGVIQYGITRAIDNRYGPPINVAGNASPGSFAGQNGQTYYQAPNGTRYGAPAQAGTMPMQNLLLLAGLGVVAFLALR